MISMSENNLAAKEALLRLSSKRRAGVLQLAKDLRIGPSRLIGLVAEAGEQGLLDVGEVRTGRAGRPRRRVRTTALGMEYLRACEALRLKALRSRRADLRRAAADADYARRLEARGVSPYDLFLELNELANDSRGPAV